MYYSSGLNFINPETVVAEKFQLEPNMTVGDFGAGSGAYALAAAKQVAAGRVYAIDIQKELLDKIKTAGRQRGFSNIEIIWGDIDRAGGSKLKDNFLDAVIIANVLFQVDSVYATALEAKRTLKPGGRALVVDWSESFGHLGPPPDKVVPADKTREIFASAGFLVGECFTAGPHHYGFIFKKPA